MKFSLKRKEEPIELEDVDGNILQCKLRELSGEERDAFLSMMNDKVKYTGEGKSAGFRDYNDVESKLVSMALIGPDGKNIEAKVIKTYPASVQAGLFDLAQKMNGLDKEADERAKKSLDQEKQKNGIS